MNYLISNDIENIAVIQADGIEEFLPKIERVAFEHYVCTGGVAVLFTTIRQSIHKVIAELESGDGNLYVTNYNEFDNFEHIKLKFERIEIY